MGSRGLAWRLRLPLGRAYHQALELSGDFDLAGQPRVRLHVVPEVEHVLFHWRRFTHHRAPGFVDMDVTGGAGAGPPAFRLDAGNAVLDRGLHDGGTDLALDRAGRTFVIDVGDARHIIWGLLRGCAAPGSYSGWRR